MMSNMINREFRRFSSEFGTRSYLSAISLHYLKKAI